jgi:hypothetical protein
MEAKQKALLGSVNQDPNAVKNVLPAGYKFAWDPKDGVIIKEKTRQGR